MKSPYSYTYSILRYVHDVTSGEFVNVGVALYAPRAHYLGAQCRPTCGRISKLFPGMNTVHFESLMLHIQGQFEERGNKIANESESTSQLGVLEIALSILPKDDSSLQWSAPGSGRIADPPKALENLYERMVMRYEERPALVGQP